MPMPDIRPVARFHAGMRGFACEPFANFQTSSIMNTYSTLNVLVSGYQTNQVTLAGIIRHYSYRTARFDAMAFSGEFIAIIGANVPG